MSDTYVFSKPEIESVAFSLNPVRVGEVIVLTVIVTEETLILKTEKRYSGELYSGEV